MLPKKCIAAVVAATALGVSLPTGAVDIVGQAYDMRSGEPLYKELHECDDNNMNCSVQYRDEAGELIASKSMDYSLAPHSPALFIQDFRMDKELRIERAPEEALVVDSGFDNYVRTQWSALSDGQDVRFRFLVAGRDKPLSMVARRDKEGCEAGQMCIKVKLDSWLLGGIVPPIELTYAQDSRRLLRFRGLSNLKDTNGDSQMVDIRYQYQSAS